MGDKVTPKPRPFTAADFAYALLGLGVNIAAMIAIGAGLHEVERRGKAERDKER